MTELQLICSPFRLVETTIKSCCVEPLPENIAIELKRVSDLTEKAFITTLYTLSEKIGSVKGSIDYRVVMPALHLNLSNDYYYGTLSRLLPNKVITCLQGSLPEFPPHPNIDWEKLIKQYLQFFPYAVNYAKIGEHYLGSVDVYLSCSFTCILLHLINKDVDYDEVELNQQFEWILTQTAVDRDLFLNVLEDDLLEKEDLKRVLSIKHYLQGVSRQLKNYPLSPLIPKWIRDQPIEIVIQNADKKIETLKEIEQTIIETKKYSPRSDRNGQHEDQTYESLSKLFVNQEEELTCITILREATKGKAVIDENGRWIGRKGSISILIAWVEVLQERGKFKERIPDTSIAELLNKYFAGLNLDTIDASIWRKITTTRNRYHADFLFLIK